MEKSAKVKILLFSILVISPAIFYIFSDSLNFNKVKELYNITPIPEGFQYVDMKLRSVFNIEKLEYNATDTSNSNQSMNTEGSLQSNSDSQLQSNSDSRKSKSYTTKILQTSTEVKNGVLNKINGTKPISDNYKNLTYELDAATTTFGYSPLQIDINNISTSSQKKYKYIKIINSCNAYFTGTCVNVRTSPSPNALSIYKLRNGVVLKVSKQVNVEGIAWYKIAFDEWLRYPERLNSDAYVSAAYASEFEDVGIVNKSKNSKVAATTTDSKSVYNGQVSQKEDSVNRTNIIPNDKYITTLKIVDKAYAGSLDHDALQAPTNTPTQIDITDIKYKVHKIVVDLSEQKLYAYEGNKLFLETSVSTGIDKTPTPVGTYTIYRKTPTRYMQGPIPEVSDHYYDLPGVPWDMFFTDDGAAIHGAYWHNEFGRRHSNGCINVPLDIAEKLYKWADVGTKIDIRN